MCLAVPGEILSVHEDEELRRGRVAFAGVVKEVCLACVPEAQVGDFVVVHAGIAIARVDPGEAARTLAWFDRVTEGGKGA